MINFNFLKNKGGVDDEKREPRGILVLSYD